VNHDLVIPLFCPAWSTRAVLEALRAHHAPRHTHVITPAAGADLLRDAIARDGWDVGPLTVHPEEDFFVPAFGLTKQDLADALDGSLPLYPPGWYFQQLLKLGAHEGIRGLGDEYLVWDADLLLVEPWPLFDADGTPAFALLQHKAHVPASNHDRWAAWIRDVLDVEPVTDPVGTFVPHHMWFHRVLLRRFKQRITRHGRKADAWPLCMIRSVGRHGTFSEYWSYASWLNTHAPQSLRYHAYGDYGSTTERFFEDGTGRFASAVRDHLGLDPHAALSPTWPELDAFIAHNYAAHDAPRPSSLAFERDDRHVKKGDDWTLLEEKRSRWRPR